MPHILHEKPMHVAAMAAVPYTEAKENAYKFESKFDKTEVNMSIRVGNTLFVPRETVPHADPQNDHRADRPAPAINCIPYITPRNEEQIPFALASVAMLKDGKNHGICAPTGWGKTVVGSIIACLMGQVTLIVVTKEDLITQWRKALVNVCGVPAHKVGMIQQDVCDVKDKQFVIAMVHSLCIPDRYPLEVYKMFGLTIFDEAHQLPAPSFIQVCQVLPAKYRLWFSATPDRPDGKTRVLEAHVGPLALTGKVVPMAPKILSRNTGWKVPKKKFVVDGKEVEEPVVSMAPGRMANCFKLMAKNQARNAELVNFAVQAWKNGRTVVIMSDLIDDHLKPLFHLLVKAGIPGHEIGFYIGGMSADKIAATLKTRMVLATYRMCDTGTDVPEWDTLILALPRARVKQAIGRVMRYKPGKKQPLIFDLVDGDKIFKGFFLSRMKEYYSVGGTIVAM